MPADDPCLLDPDYWACQSGHAVDAPEIATLFQRLGLTVLLVGVLVGILLVLVLVYWRTEERERHGF